MRDCFLPIIDSVIIDGTTQPGWAPGHPVIEIDGSEAGDCDGLRFRVGGNTVKGLIINHYAGSGIVLDDLRTPTTLDPNPGPGRPKGGSRIEGNFIERNGNDGILILDSAHNTIGGRTDSARNVISGNGLDGIVLVHSASTDNHVEGNFIGTDRTGLIALGNQRSGIAVRRLLGADEDEGGGFASGNFIGGTDLGARNVISGNVLSGVSIFRGTENTVVGNYIGVGQDGKTPVRNGEHGVLIDGGSSNTIGAPDIFARNVISGNTRNGVKIVQGDFNTVQNNYIGISDIGVDGVTPVPNGDAFLIDEDGVLIDGGSHNTIGGTTHNSGNVISANQRNGVTIQAVAGTAEFNRVQGNKIGTAPNGEFGFGFGNGQNGVEIRNESSNESVTASFNRIGGADEDDGVDGLVRSRNLISGNFGNGVLIAGHRVTNNQIEGNFIGTNGTGTKKVGNLLSGVRVDFIEGQSSGPLRTSIGGTLPGTGNVISGNNENGVLINGSATTTTVLKNFIGTQFNGLEPLGNGGNGVTILNSSGNTIGSLSDDEGNVISANALSGVAIIHSSGSPAASGNVVAGNFIGTDRVGFVSNLDGVPGSGDELGNRQNGVVILNASGNFIGVATGSTNVIGGNFENGVVIAGTGATDNKVRRNMIGVAVDGSRKSGSAFDLGNQFGVLITHFEGGGASKNVIGGRTVIDGADTDLGNVISGNRLGGVRIDFGAFDNQVDSNLIGTNQLLEIIPNGRCGVSILNASKNWIGRTFGNEISYTDIDHSVDPIAACSGTGVSIRGKDSTENHVQNNRIFSNDVFGIEIANEASGNFVGAPGDGNEIFGNQQTGVVIFGEGTRANLVEGNSIGVIIEDEGLGNTLHGVNVALGASANTIGGATEESGNTIISNEGFGVVVNGNSHNNSVLNNVIGVNGSGGISIDTGASDNHIEANIIGSNRDGDMMPNRGCGIRILNAAKNSIGKLAGNSIFHTESDPDLDPVAACSGTGISIRGTDSKENHVQNNTVFSNDAFGIEVGDGASRNFIGAPGAGNEVIENKNTGIVIFGEGTMSNSVVANSIGLATDGEAQGNGFAGVQLSRGTSDNTIGGLKSDSRNVISANKQFGVLINSDAHNNLVLGNLIGTEKEGALQTDFGNKLGGISISDAHANIIGETAETAGLSPGNMILGNSGPGVLISGSRAHENLLHGNAIARNSVYGVHIEGGAHDNFIGGEVLKQANRIHNNGKAGVFVESGIRNVIVDNKIFANGGLGIDLAPEGVTENDVTAKDQDSGPNNLQNFPVLSFATTKGSHRIAGALGSARKTSYAFQFFASDECDPGVVNDFHFGEGERFLFETEKPLKSNASGVVIFDLPLPESATAGMFVTATARDPEGNTSEFSNCVEVLVDTDGDGVSDDRENAGPNGGDGNQDGVADSAQLHVATFLNALDSAHVTLVAHQETTLHNVRALPNPSPDDDPPGVQFDQGFFDFEIAPLPIGGSIELEMILAGRVPNNYFRYGPTPDNPNPHWYNWLFDGQTGADIRGNRITLHFVDGARGDDDLEANGIIEDAGAPAFPDPFTVITTADSGEGSLRQAILNANANPGLDEIAFNIPGTDPLSIQPLSALPTITDPIVIDGTTQPSFAGIPIVELDGSLAGAGVNGLTLAVADGPLFDEEGNIELSIIRGLVINRFSASGIRIEQGGMNTIEGNFIGTDVSGTIAVANGSFGIEIDDSADNSIGGSEAGAGNVISGNSAGGILIHGRGAAGTFLTRNLIGTQADGAVPLGNGGPGVLMDNGARINFVGSSNPDDGNTIAFNAGPGVEIRSGSGNPVQANSIFSNAGLGIDLGGDGVTPNDSSDSDPGSNSLQNFPILTRVARHGDRTFIHGTLNSTPNSTFTVEFFASSAADPSGFGEGQTFLGSTSVATDSTGKGTIEVNFEHPLTAGSVVTATATDRNRNTSEFSEPPSDLAVPVPLPFVFTVDTIEDVNDGVDCLQTSLREAILAANAHPGPDIIRFNIAGENRTISPTSPLPDITDPVTIDGTTQPGYAGLPLIELEGSQAGTDANGLRITGGGSVVRGLVINRFRFDPFSFNPTGGSGIVLAGAGGNRIEGNFLGTDLTGTGALPNDVADVTVVNSSDNLIGGTTLAARNIITTVSLGFRFSLSGGNNRVQGNYIGTDVTGSALLLGSAFRGVILVQGSGNVIGGTEPGAGNLIANGLVISSGRDNVVQGNLIGTDVTGTRFLFGRGSVELAGGSPATTVVNNLIGGTTTAARNIIANTVRLSGFASGNVIQGNYIGTDITGTVDFPDVAISPTGSDAGVEIAGANNTIGGTTPGAGNLISGKPSGVFLDRFATGNVLQGNRIGTDASGTKALGNSFGIFSTGQNNTIGGSMPGAGNLISGNLADGLRLVGFGRNVVQANFIGTDVSGTVALGNAGHGVFVAEHNVIVGGSELGAGNVISGNGGNGITVAVGGVNPSGTTIQGNFIGTDVTGTARLGNSGAGISIGRPNSRIGGSLPGAGNVISANRGGGLTIGSTGNIVEGNRIGTDVAGARDLGNLGDGVSLLNSSFVVANNRIGGEDAAAGNVIAFNSGHGISARFSTGNAIRSNAIFANSGLGIVTGIDGVLLTYAEERGISAPNIVPVLTSALFHEQGTIVEVTITGTPFTRYTLDLFANDTFDSSGFGEAQTFLESFTMRTGATGQAQLSLPLEAAVPVGRWITATATDTAGTTSQLSRAIPVVAAGEPNTVQITAPAYLVTENGGEAVVIVNRIGSTTGTVTVNFTTTDAFATAGSDYAVASGTLTFGDGETSKAITIPISDDAIGEGDETFQITLSDPIGVSLGSLSAAIVTIADNEVSGQLDFATSALSVSEGGQVKLQVTRTGGTLGRISVDYRVTGGTATPCVSGGLDISCSSANDDYSDFFGKLTFEDGQTTAEIVVSAFDDQSPDGGEFEGPETVEVSLGNPTGGAVLGPVTNTVLTVLDEEDLHGAFAVSGAVVNESAGSATVIVFRAGNRSETASVTITTRDATAVSGSDYLTRSHILTFFPADSAKTVSIPIVNDAVVEEQEAFEVFLSDPTGGAILSAGTDRDVVILRDDDSPGRFVVLASTVHENADSNLVNVERRDGTKGVAEVNFATSDGLALAGSDYTATSGTITFNDGETQKTIIVPILRDTLIEGGETFLVTLSDPTGGATVGSDNTAVLTIFEMAGEFEFLASSHTLAEANAGFTVTVTLTRFPDSDQLRSTLERPVTVEYTIHDGTAQAGADYSAVAGTLTFGLGETRKTFTIPIFNDSLVEGDETILLTLSGATGGLGFGDRATATITILNEDFDGPPPNQSQILTPDIATTDEDTAVSKNVLTNDALPHGQALEISAFDTTSVHGGTVTCTTTGDCTYTPAADFTGTDTFTYTACDVCGDKSTTTVTITVNPLNDDAPNSNPDTAITDEDTTVTKNVLSNDTDANGDSLAVSSFDATTARGGTVTCMTTGDCTYTPAADFNGTDTFSYTASDGHGGTATATVTITVNAVNDAPTPNPDTAETDEDSAVTKSVLNNDTDVEHDILSVSAFDATTTHGGSVHCTATGDCAYTPAANFNGTDSFSYTASDRHGSAATTTVTVTVNALNDVPTAFPDTAETDEDATATRSVLSNDTDMDGESLAIVAFDALSSRGGLVHCTPTGECTYTPTADFNGTDTFSYTVSDGHDRVATGTVTVIVNPVNDPPQFEAGPNVSSRSDGAQVVENWTSGFVSGPDNEAEQSLHFVLTTARPDLFTELPTVRPDGSLTYTPRVGVTGVATVAIQLVDDAGTDRGGSDRTTLQTFSIAIAASTPTNETTCTAVVSSAAPRATGGNVRVRFSHGGLSIRGDSAHNAIGLDGLTAGSYEIHGLAGTTINGRSEPFRATAITGLTKINLASGDDTLILNAPVTLGRLAIRSGPTDSRFATRAESARGDQDMVVLIDALLGGRLTVRSGRDADHLALCGTESNGPVRLRTGSNSDIVQLDNLTTQGPLAVSTGRGNDAVLIEQSRDITGTPSVMQGPTKLRTRRGNDRVLIGSNGSPVNSSQFRERTRIRGGRGQDLIDAALDTTPNSRGNQFLPNTQIDGVEIEL